MKILFALFLVLAQGTSPKTVPSPPWLTIIFFVCLGVFVLGAVIILFLYAFNVLKFSDEPNIDEVLDEMRARRRAVREERSDRKHSRAREWARKKIDDEEGITRHTQTPEDEAAEAIPEEKFYYLLADVNKTHPLSIEDVNKMLKTNKGFKFYDENGIEFKP